MSLNYFSQENSLRNMVFYLIIVLKKKLLKMASLSECMTKLQKLTQTNLDILQALNDSFTTNHNHLSVDVAGTQYAIPSFISLENKINLLQENFNNLVHAPETGEAFFSMDGNSRSIEVRSYTNTPNSIVLPVVNEFGANNNDIFKDFMTPTPYINVNLAELPNDTVQVLMKKVVPIHPDLTQLFKTTIGESTSVQYSYKDLYKILTRYVQDQDYIEYDTKLDLPIRKNIGSGVYVIDSIISDEVDENLDNYIVVKFRTDMKESVYMNTLKYRLFDETIERPLKVGDKLVTFEGNAKVEIVELYPNTNQVKFKVLHGEYLNLVPSTSNLSSEISDLSKLKFFSPIDFDNDKYVQVPLEEDEFVFVSIAALNNRMNVQSSWGSGLMIHTYELTRGDEKFKQYYESNVRNVGDVLYEISSIMSNTLMKYGKDDFEKMVQYMPSWESDNLVVTQINKHLNDSETVKNIRSLYSQKKDIKNQLDEIQSSISALNDKLSTTSFDDSTGVRSAYLSELSDLNAKKNELNSSMMKTVNEISLSANNSEIPLENGKYRIRGYVDIESIEESNPILKGHIKGIRVQYRYKTIDSVQGSAMTISLEDGNKSFLFSDWNNMTGFDRERVARYDEGYKFSLEDPNDNTNAPSFNQIDIPISQGETVDIRYRVVYDYGQPFVQVSSNWSPIINIKFPDEFLKDVQILDILSENNDDIETNRFKNIISEGGVDTHVADKVTDQDVTYFHKPENIASGFYTQERRIIPLKDKLADMNNILTEIYDEVKGSSMSDLSISIIQGDAVTDLLPYQVNNLSVEPYSGFDAEQGIEGLYQKDNRGVITTTLNLSIKNTSQHNVKLFSLFPGDRDTEINQIVHTKFEKGDYTSGNGLGVWFEHGSGRGGYIHRVTSGPGGLECELQQLEGVTRSIQRGNQFIYFRIKNAYNGESYYAPNEASEAGKPTWSPGSDYLSLVNSNMASNGAGKGAWMYPSVQDRYGLSMDSNAINESMIIPPEGEIIIPIIFEYKLDKEVHQVTKTMSFDLRTSLYSDPINYTFRVTAKDSDSLHDRLLIANRVKFGTNRKNNIVKYSPTVK